MDLKGRSLLTLLDFTPEEIIYLLDRADEFKAMKKAGTAHRLHEGKNIALIFEKTSTRTRCAFEVAAADLGMHSTYLGPDSSQLGKKESIADTARVLGRMYEGIEFRGFRQDHVEALAKYSGVPVWNGLTDDHHPTQALADLMTIREHLGRLKGVRAVFYGDCDGNTSNSLMAACALTGMSFTACAPEGYLPGAELTARCRAVATATGAEIRFESDPLKAAAGADVIYTDVWVSMGESDDLWQERIDALLPYRVDSRVMEAAGPQALFMHCLPAFHDLETGTGRRIHELYGLEAMEVTDEVFESPASIVFDEAENRMHTIKAIMAETLG